MELDFRIRADGLTMPDVSAQMPWQTLGKYIADKQSGGMITPHQNFRKTFTYGKWREYSTMAHGAFEGLMPVTMYYIADS